MKTYKITGHGKMPGSSGPWLQIERIVVDKDEAAAIGQTLSKIQWRQYPKIKEMRL